MSDTTKEPVFVDVRSNDRSLVLDVMGRLMDRPLSGSLEIGRSGDVYRLSVAEVAAEATAP